MKHQKSLQTEELEKVYKDMVFFGRGYLRRHPDGREEYIPWEEILVWDLDYLKKHTENIMAAGNSIEPIVRKLVQESKNGSRTLKE